MWLLTKRRHNDGWESGHVPRFHLDEGGLAASGVVAWLVQPFTVEKPAGSLRTQGRPKMAGSLGCPSSLWLDGWKRTI